MERYLIFATRAGRRAFMGVVALAVLLLYAGCTWKTKGTYEADGNIPALGAEETGSGIKGKDPGERGGLLGGPGRSEEDFPSGERTLPR